MSEKILNINPITFPWKTEDPFLFCAYHLDLYPPGNGHFGPKKEALSGRYIGQDFSGKDGWSMYHGQDIPGFPYHPHRGFETVTINKKGVVDHSDSLGAAGRFMAGDVQWMTAGKGVQHSEMFPLIHEDQPNHLEIFQIWLNLPAKNKFVEPHFKMLWKEAIPVIDTIHNDCITQIDLVAGSYRDYQAPETTPDSWAANPENGVRILTVKIDVGGMFDVDAVAKEANRNIYFYKGDQLTIDGKEVNAGHIIKLKPDEAIALENRGSKTAFLLLLEGKPINEPVAQHGPFVMNTMDEIQETMMEFQRTQFGGWPWKDREKSHGADLKRFAIHADGREEIKE